MLNIELLLKRYKNLPLVAVWKTIIISEGVNSFLNKSEFEKEFKGYKFKYAVKNPSSVNFEVLDRSSDQRVIPSEAILNDGQHQALVKLRYNPESIISISFSKEKKGKLQLFFFVRGKKIFAPLDISLLKEMGDSTVGMLGTDRLSVILFDGCWNWNSGCQCKFCDLNPKRKDYSSAVPDLNNLRNFNFDCQLWWENYKSDFFKALDASFKKMYEIAQPHKHLLIMSGGFPDNDFLWKMIIESVRKLNSLVPLKKFDSYVNVPAPSSNIEENFLKLKRIGVKQMQINLEVAGKKKFETVCPGKDKTIGYDNYQKALKMAVKIFGRGQARSNFVFTSRSGKELLKEAERLAKLGVIFDYSIFQPKKGTPWAHKKSPSANEILSFTQSLAKIYRRYGFTGIYCNLSSRSSIINEVIKYGN